MLATVRVLTGWARAQVFGTLNPIWRVIDKDTWTTTMSESDVHKLEVSLHAVTLPFEPRPVRASSNAILPRSSPAHHAAAERAEVSE